LPTITLAALALVLALLPQVLAAQEDDPNTVVDPAFFSNLEYRLVGPHRGGRSTAATGVPGHPFLFYFGSTGGGVWKTVDAGETWMPITDGQIDAGSIGAIAVAESDPNVLYVGTGSACIRGNVSPGVGVYRSTDAGRTWTHIGLENAGQIGKIRVHPKDPDLVYVAVLGDVFGPHEERGVFRSEDGGETWEKVLYIDEHTGVVDLSMNPSNPRIIYAGAWRGERKPWTLISGSEEGGVYMTTDGGDTWNKATGGLPQGLVGRVGVAVSPANPDRVWALIEHEKGGLYRSDDGGRSWRLINEDHMLWERPWYYMHITADPKDPNTVWVSNVFLSKSVDGGGNFTLVPTAHGDNHDLWINPDNTDIMINADDGGAAVTLTGGRSWSTLWNQPTAEFYRVTVDNQFPYRLYGPQQDNSTISVPSRPGAGTLSPTEEIFQVGGCESGHIAVDPRDPNIVYAGCYGGSIGRIDRRHGQIREVVAYPQLQLAQLRQDLRYRFQWNAPIRISPHDPDIIYHTAQVVLRSRNGGQSWEEISPDLTTDNPEHQDYAGGPITRDGTGVEVYGTIFAFEESPYEAGVLWAGSDDGLLHVSRDNGGTWTNVTPEGLPAGATINSIDISAHDPARVFISAYRYREDDFRPYIFRTNDYGESWDSLTDGSNGIPEDRFTRIVREDPGRRGLLYAGTEFGIYVSFDDGAHWQSFQLNLPITPVTDLQIHQNDLVVATQGRSFWILDDLTPLHQLTDDVMAATAHLFEARPTYRVFSGGAMPGGGGGGRSGQGPEAGALIHYSLGEDVEGTVSLEITDADGETIQTFTSDRPSGPDLGPLASLAAMFGMDFGGGALPTQRGLHRFAWDLRYPAPTSPQGIVIFGMIQGPLASPGTYRATLTVGELSQTREFEVLPDPRVDATQADFDAQLDFLLEVGDAITELAGKLEQLRTVREQVKQVAARVGDAGIDEETARQIEEAADAMAEKLTAVEDDMVQTRSHSLEDPLNYPGRLYAQLANVQSLTNGGFGAVDAPPTDGAVEFFAELQAQAAETYARLQEVIDTDLPAFNEMVGALDLPAVIVKNEEGG
jgi:photosystem II stability/assembly factor-like uncharacterized protein